MVNQKYLNTAFINLNLRVLIPSFDFIKEDTNSKEAISIGDYPFASSEWVGGQQGAVSKSSLDKFHYSRILYFLWFSSFFSDGIRKIIEKILLVRQPLFYLLPVVYQPMLSG